MSDYPLLERRNAIFQSEGGPRLNLSNLHQSFTEWERFCWYCVSVTFPYDEFGAHPEKVEQFLGVLGQQ